MGVLQEVRAQDGRHASTDQAATGTAARCLRAASTCAPSPLGASCASSCHLTCLPSCIGLTPAERQHLTAGTCEKRREPKTAAVRSGEHRRRRESGRHIIRPAPGLCAAAQAQRQRGYNNKQRPAAVAAPSVPQPVGAAPHPVVVCKGCGGGRGLAELIRRTPRASPPFPRRPISLAPRPDHQPRRSVSGPAGGQHPPGSIWVSPMAAMAMSWSRMKRLATPFTVSASTCESREQVGWGGCWGRRRKGGGGTQVFAGVERVKTPQPSEDSTAATSSRIPSQLSPHQCEQTAPPWAAGGRRPAGCGQCPQPRLQEG